MPTVPTRSGALTREGALEGGMQRSIASPTLLNGNADQLVQMGAGLTQLGNVGQAIQYRNDTDKAFRTEVAVKSAWMEADAELRKRYRGASVEGYKEEAQKWWDESPAKFGSDLSDGARGIASRSLQAARLQAQSSVTGYYTQEKDRGQAESWEAAKGIAIQEATTDMRPEVLATARKNLILKNSEYAATRGWSAEQLQVQNIKDANVLHTTIIGKLQDQDPAGAKAYYEQNRGEIDASQHAKIEKVLTTAVNEQEGKKLADALAGKPYDEVLQEVAKITSPELRKAASFHARQNQADIAVATSAREKAASDKVWQAVAKGARPNQLPASLLEQMDGKERVAINAHYEAEAKRRRSEAEGKPVKSDMRVIENLYSMPKDDFLNLRISTLGDKLSRADMEEQIKRQAALRDPKKAPEVVSMEQQVSATAQQMRIKDENAGAFKQAVYTELTAAAKANGGKELDYEARQKVIDRLTIKRDSWFSSNTRLYQVKGTPEEKAFVAKLGIDDVPRQDRALIEDALKRAGRPASEADILTMFKTKLSTQK